MVVDFQGSMPGNCVEVAVSVKDDRVRTYRHGGDKAVYELSDGLATLPARPVKGGSVVVVGGSRIQCHGSLHKPFKAPQVFRASSASQHLHSYRVADGKLAFKERVDALASWRAGVPQELNPCGRID